MFACLFNNCDFGKVSIVSTIVCEFEATVTLIISKNHHIHILSYVGIINRNRIKIDGRTMIILTVGLDDIGKATTLHKLKLGEVLITLATTRFDVERVEYNIGAQDKIRSLWRHYYPNTQGIVFVGDSNDREGIDNSSGTDNSAKEELNLMLAQDALRDVILLV